MIRLVVEEEAYEGVKRVTEILAKDFEKVFSKEPEVTNSVKEDSQGNIIVATVGKSSLLNKYDLEEKISISNKRECFQIFWHENNLFVVGSDKRGTIYGLFEISRQIGVSPFVYWGDDTPEKRSCFEKSMIEEKTSKEPSVCYRGFFINDEWPCFGNWTSTHFGGFTAEMYEKVFEFLLRLKGNCLWPAMWSSSFALDGPGSLNEELADIYGVIISYSHHEPCLRASEDWDIYKGPEYGTEWNYSTNKNGLLKYWKDGLLRSGKYENIITMGMRGERDSVMQGAAGLKDSIELWKDIITEQDKLILEAGCQNHPKLVAIYKEVEDYFFGDSKTEGLKGWDGLKDKLLMFCEDNHGYMRRLPDENMKQHKGGLGMYYHLDYHGDPVSYEWINSTPLYQLWEQMCEAYNAGINKMWIVNVGDLKGNEIPLSYFMELAYDFDTWGSTNLNSYNQYQAYWSGQVFGNELMGLLYEEAVKLIYLRRPEALKVDTFSLVNGEDDYLIEEINKNLEKLDGLKEICPVEKREAFFSLVEYPVLIGLNHMLLFLYAGKNKHFALQGKKIANYYGNLVSDCYVNEKQLKARFRYFKDKKWQGMELAAHTGFTKWNQDGAVKPVRYTVEPLEEPHMVVSIPGQAFTAGKNYGSPERIVVDSYNYKGLGIAAVEVANTGLGLFNCEISCKSKDYSFSWLKKKVTGQELLLIKAGKNAWPAEAVITDGDTSIILELRPPKTYRVINALEVEKNCSFGGIYLNNFGKHRAGVKVTEEKSSFVYKLQDISAEDALLEIILAPTNPTGESPELSFGLKINGSDFGEITVTDKDYKAGNSACSSWAKGTLSHERRITIGLSALKGDLAIELYDASQGLIFEKIVVKDKSLLDTYLEIGNKQEKQ